LTGTNPGNPESHPTLGDIDGDGHATLLDALLLYRWLAGQPVPNPPTCPDVTYDGACDVKDALTLYQWTIRAPGFEILPKRD